MLQVDRTSHARGGLAWHPDGSLLAAAGTSNNLVVYERLSWDPLYELEDAHTGPVNCLAFSPNGMSWVSHLTSYAALFSRLSFSCRRH